MIKLIASDLDGTLLQGGAQALNPEVYDLILQLKSRGIRFAAASGRQLQSLQHLFSPIKDDISYIAENGSLCIHEGTVIAKGIIQRELGLEIIQAARQYGDCHLLLSCQSRSYTDSTSEAFMRHLKDVLHVDIVYCEDLTTLEEPFLKIAYCDFQGTRDLLPFFQERFQDRIKAVTSGNIWVDFIAPGANKGTALKQLAAYLDVRPEECVAFGDQYNDTEMLQFAGTSYAMATAAPGIDKYATHVTDSVEKILREIAEGGQTPLRK